jgi:4-hydroxy-3-methylbut-2-enyl diphosphate reductase
MNIIRADHLGMCFGVRDAIALAEQQARVTPLTILGELAHNEAVLSRLRAQGIGIEDRLEQVRTATVMVTAHGASDQAMDLARTRGLRVLEATCPLVKLVHQSMRELVRQGYHPIIIGRREHVEVRGLTEDLRDYDVILRESDLGALRARPRFGVVAQTTQPIEHVRGLVARLRQRFPESEVRFIDTVCQPTKQRQAAAVELAQQSEVVVVIGGSHSNNTLELVATCRRHCARVHQVQSADDLRPDWFEGADKIGITAGTSTPDVIIDGVEQWLRQRLESRVSTKQPACPLPISPATTDPLKV